MLGRSWEIAHFLELGANTRPGLPERAPGLPAPGRGGSAFLNRGELLVIDDLLHSLVTREAIAERVETTWGMLFSEAVSKDYFGGSQERTGRIMSTTTLIIVIVVLVLLFGGGGYYWRGRR